MQTRYLRNSLINYTKREVDNYSLSDYFSLSLNDIQEYIDSCPKNWFELYRLGNITNLEKVALDIYSDPDYWDIILIVNKRNPLFDLPFEFDVLIERAEKKVMEYADTVYAGALPTDIETTMIDAYLSKFDTDNELFRIINIVKPSKLQEFLQGGYDRGYFK